MKALYKAGNQLDQPRVIEQAREVFEIEAQAISRLSEIVDGRFSDAVEMILACPARVIVCGMGKSGIIGHKISSTLASTGTPSFFMHPAEAFHGDLGILQREDVLLLISYSGQTEEILKIIPFLKENGNFMISMTGDSASMLARSSDIHLDVSVKQEACPLQMAPTASSTTALVMGDALAVALMKARDFKAENFARFHPGGNLGRRLLTKAEDVMKRDNLPTVSMRAPMKEIIRVMTSGRLGVAVVVNDDSVVSGIITDGDLRRAMEKSDEKIFNLRAGDICAQKPKTIHPGAKLYEIEKIFTAYEITTLIVSDDGGRLLGLVNVHDLS